VEIKMGEKFDTYLRDLGLKPSEEELKKQADNSKCCKCKYHNNTMASYPCCSCSQLNYIRKDFFTKEV